MRCIQKRWVVTSGRGAVSHWLCRYDQTKHFLMQYLGDTFGAFLGASAVAGLASAVVSTPADVVKVRRGLLPSLCTTALDPPCCSRARLPWLVARPVS